jgi:DNA-binding NarL/FixJ family response regulator
MTHLSDTNKNKRLVCSYLFDYPAQCNKNISVTFLTVFEAQQDIANAYNMRATWRITKPVDLKKCFNIIKLIEAF